MFIGILFQDGKIEGDPSGFKLDFLQTITSYKSASYILWRVDQKLRLY